MFVAIDNDDNDDNQDHDDNDDNDDDCGGNPSDILFVASDNHENALMKTTMIMMITMITMMTYCLSPMISNITMEAVNK